MGGDPYNEIPTIPSSSYQIVNTVDSIGFFNSDLTEFLVDSNHVKQPDLMLNMSTIQGGNTVSLYKSPSFGNSGEEPQIGDLLLINGL